MRNMGSQLGTVGLVRLKLQSGQYSELFNITEEKLAQMKQAIGSEKVEQIEFTRHDQQMQRYKRRAVIVDWSVVELIEVAYD
jgi:sporulation protein YlmC with PRC-barrel domain